MKKNTHGLTNVVVTGFELKERAEISAIISKTLDELMDIYISPAEEDNKVWIDLRCTFDQFEAVKSKIQKDLKRFSKVNASVTYAEQD
jgi:hypothetical protein